MPNPLLLLAILIKRAGGEAKITREELAALEGQDLDLAIGLFDHGIAMRTCTPDTREQTMRSMAAAFACTCSTCEARRHAERARLRERALVRFTKDRRFESPLLTTVKEGLGGSTCRVCGEGIEHGEEVRSRAWGVERAHARCGWFREGEGLEPTERRTGGSFRTFLEWRCPECGLDACADSARFVPADRRCGRCAQLRAGELAELREEWELRGSGGKVRIPAGFRVKVEELRQAAEGSLAQIAIVSVGGARWSMRGALLRRVLE